MLAFIGGDVTDCREDIGGMSSSAFYAISVIDPSFAGFMIDVEILQIVVKVDRSSTQVSCEQSGVRGEDCSDIDATFSAKRESNPR